MTDATYDPASHYDRVTEAWSLLLGEELHYGVFARGDETLPEATAALTGRMLDACRIEPGVDVLDVGCGTGAPACAMAALGARVLGVTTSHVGVSEATARAARHGVADSATFQIADGTDNGFPNSSFDRVWVLESSHLMRDRARLVSECARVLRPGGRLALCDVMLRRPMPFEEVRRLVRPLALLREVFGDARMEPLEQYVDQVKGSGLNVDTIEDLTDATRPTFARWRANAKTNREAVLASIGEADWQQFVDSCDVLNGFWDDGTLGYGLLAASHP